MGWGTTSRSFGCSNGFGLKVHTDRFSGLSFEVDTDRNPKPNLLLPTSTSSLLTSKYDLSIIIFVFFEIEKFLELGG